MGKDCEITSGRIQTWVSGFMVWIAPSCPHNSIFHIYCEIRVCVNLTLSVLPDRPTTVSSFGSTTVDILTSPLPVVSMMSTIFGFPSVVVCVWRQIHYQSQRKDHGLFLGHKILKNSNETASKYCMFLVC